MIGKARRTTKLSVAIDPFTEAENLPLQLLAQVHPLDELHHEIWLLVPQHPRVDHVDDVGVPGSRRRLRLAPHPIHELRSHPVFRMQHLQGEAATEGQVLSLVDRPHRPETDEAPEAIFLPGHQPHSTRRELPVALEIKPPSREVSPGPPPR